jgi:hypothetical protein
MNLASLARTSRQQLPVMTRQVGVVDANGNAPLLARRRLES